MKILYILPGSGGSFYCQNCLRDTALTDALRQRGHDVTLLPLYLPATASIPQPTDVPIFYGAVSLYLRHRCSFLRKLPKTWFAPLDRWPVLRMAAHFSGTTSARGLEDLTLSMLKGLDGRQADELRDVCQWLKTLDPDTRPDIIVLSNALLSGMASALRETAACPVVCWLQDEHVWTDAMDPVLRDAVLHTLAADARAIDRFVAVSAFYAARMTEALALDPARVCVVPPGIDPDAYAHAAPAKSPPVIGFLSRLSAEEGFDRFVDAFLLLRRDPRFADARLSATGGPSSDRHFLRNQVRKLTDAGARDAVSIVPDRFARDRFAFLSELSLLCVPGGDHPEAFGYYAVEAMATGVPVVLPDQGAFPEIAAATSCGTLVADTRPATLARAWRDRLNDPSGLREEAARGRAAVRCRFSQTTSAAALEGVLQACLADQPQG